MLHTWTMKGFTSACVQQNIRRWIAVDLERALQALLLGGDLRDVLGVGDLDSAGAGHSGLQRINHNILPRGKNINRETRRVGEGL